MEYKNFKPQYIVENQEELGRLEKVLEVLDNHTECRDEKLSSAEVLVKYFMDGGATSIVDIYPQDGFCMPFFNHGSYNYKEKKQSEDLPVTFTSFRSGYEITLGDFSYNIHMFPLSALKYEMEQWKRDDAEFNSKYPNSFSKIKNS